MYKKEKKIRYEFDCDKFQKVIDSVGSDENVLLMLKAKYDIRMSQSMFSKLKRGYSNTRPSLSQYFAIIDLFKLKLDDLIVKKEIED